jgi:hypothetical protein
MAAVALVATSAAACSGSSAKQAPVVTAPAPTVALLPTTTTIAPVVIPPNAAGEIAYACGGGLCLVGGDGSDPHVSPGGGGLMGFATNGRNAVAVFDAMPRENDGEMQVGPPSGRAFRTVWTFAGTLTSYPAVSPDGTKAAFLSRAGTYSSMTGGIPQGLYVVDSDGHDPHRVAANAVGPVTWDPTGTHLAFLAFSGDSDRPSAETIDVVAATGDDARQVAVVWSRATDPALQEPSDGWAWLSWSPDGRTILYSDLNGLLGTPGFNRVETFPAAGGPGTMLLAGSSLPPAPSWPTTSITYQFATYSPDGTSFAVLVTCSAATSPGNPNAGYSELELADPDGGHLRPVFDPTGTDPCKVRTPAILKAADDQPRPGLEPTYILGWARWSAAFNDGL